MRAIELVMLAAQALALAVAIWTIAGRRPVLDRRRPVQSILGFALLLISIASTNIADRHTGDMGAEFLRYGAGVLLGMALALFLLAFRERRFGAGA